VPVYVRFGQSVLRDWVDLKPEDLYARLRQEHDFPATSQPSPEDFVKVYQEAALHYDGIISIHLSSKLSGTYSSAVLAKNLMKTTCPIDVIDSAFVSGGLGLTVITAARAAQSGQEMTAILSEIRRSLSKMKMFGIFNTLKYLAKGGRIHKTVALAGDILHVKPLLTFNEGEIVRSGIARTFSQGLQRITDYIAARKTIAEMMITHSDFHEMAEDLKKRAAPYLANEKIIISRLGAALGIHAGPGALLVALKDE
jgi:DegV family protein with EDD domain